MQWKLKHSGFDQTSFSVPIQRFNIRRSWTNLEYTDYSKIPTVLLHNSQSNAEGLSKVVSDKSDRRYQDAFRFHCEWLKNKLHWKVFSNCVQFYISFVVGFASMRLSMFEHVILADETFSTGGAGEWLVARMKTHVPSKVRFVIELFRTHFTLVRFVAGMFREVLQMQVFLSETFSTPAIQTEDQTVKIETYIENQ